MSVQKEISSDESILRCFARRVDRAKAQPVETEPKLDFEPKTRRRHDDAIHGAGQSRQELGSRGSPGPKDPDRDGEVQRRARERGAPSKLEGRARQIRRQEADRDRRGLHRDQGVDRRLLDVAGEVEGRGDRMAQARSVRSDRGGDPPGVRAGGLWPCADSRGSEVRAEPARTDGREEAVTQPWSDGVMTMRFMMLMIPKGYEKAA